MNIPEIMDALQDHHLASWLCEKILVYIHEFESDLDNDEVVVCLVPFGSKMMIVEEIGYQNPDIVHIYGSVDEKRAELLQHVGQLNLLLMAEKREDKNKPVRPIGFRAGTLQG